MIQQYPERFLAWLAERKPEVRHRILRLNSMPWHEGQRRRGYHPHRRSTDHWRGEIGKREFINKFGRDAWRRLPRSAIVHKGHRKAVTQDTLEDQLWLVADDHPIRQAYKRKGQWCIPS